MAGSIRRREALKQLTFAGAALVWPGGVIRGDTAPLVVNGQPVELAIAAISPVTVRVTVRPLDGTPTADHNALVAAAAGRVVATGREPFASIRAGGLTVRFTPSPPTIHVSDRAGRIVQKLTLDAASANVSFLLPKGPLLGFGEGGPQFDRKGTTDRMRNGQGGYQLRTHGGRVPIQWLIGTDGWGGPADERRRH